MLKILIQLNTKNNKKYEVVWKVAECQSSVVVYNEKHCEAKFWQPTAGQVRQLHPSAVSFSHKSKWYTLMSQ